MQCTDAPDRPLPRWPLRATAAALAGLMALAVAALMWASGDHGTHCVADVSGYGQADPGRYLHPIFIGCTAAALVLASALLVLSARRRSPARSSLRRPGLPSIAVAAITVWCAAVYLPLVLWSASSAGSDVVKIVAAPPIALLVAVGVVAVYLRYALFIPLLGLIAAALTRSSVDAGYRLMQIAVVYAMLGCIAVSVGSDLLLVGFCLG